MDFDSLVVALRTALAGPGGVDAATGLVPDPGVVAADAARTAALTAVSRVRVLPRPDPSVAQPLTWAPQLMARTEGDIAVSGPGFEVRPRFAWSNMVTSLGGDLGQPNWVGTATGWAFRLAVPTVPTDGAPSRDREVVVVVSDDAVEVIFPTGDPDRASMHPLDQILDSATVDAEIPTPALLARFAGAAAVLEAAFP